MKFYLDDGKEIYGQNARKAGVSWVNKQAIIPSFFSVFENEKLVAVFFSDQNGLDIVRAMREEIRSGDVARIDLREKEELTEEERATMARLDKESSENISDGWIHYNGDKKKTVAGYTLVAKRYNRGWSFGVETSGAWLVYPYVDTLTLAEVKIKAEEYLLVNS